MASKSNSGSSTGSDVPQPMEGLNQMGPPPFLNKTYEIVDDSSTNHVVSWSKENNSFIVWDPLAFSITLLPKYFKHNNFSSFIRQLNTYGFRKVDPDKWKFANEDFLRGKKYLLKNIRRRRAGQSQASNQQVLDSACVEVGRFGLDGEIDQLKRDKQILMVELVKLRQQQQTTNTRLQLMEHRMKRTETKQQQLMGFMARAMQNPNFMQQLAQQKEMRKELEEAIRKKRRRPIEQVPSDHLVVEEGVEIFGDLVKIEAEVHEFGDFEVPDQLDGLEMSIEGSIRGMDLLEARVESVEEMGNIVEDVDVGFWENLLNKHCVEEMGVLGSEVGNEQEDVDVLVELLGCCIGSSPK